MAFSSKFSFSLLLILSFLVLVSVAKDVRYCDKKAGYDVKVSGVDITPDPVVRGNKATFNISASAGKAISEGKLLIEVSYFGWHVHTETHDLCSETSCPVVTGDFAIAHSQVLPSYTPPGSYSLKMKIMGENDCELSCIAFDFSIGLATSVASM